MIGKFRTVKFLPFWVVLMVIAATIFGWQTFANGGIPQEQFAYIKTSNPRSSTCGTVYDQEVFIASSATGQNIEKIYQVSNPCETLNDLVLNNQRTVVAGIQLNAIRVINISTKAASWVSNSSGCYEPGWRNNDTELFCVKSGGVNIFDFATANYKSRVAPTNTGIKVTSADTIPNTNDFVIIAEDPSATCAFPSGTKPKQSIWRLAPDGSTKKLMEISCISSNENILYRQVAVSPDGLAIAFLAANSVNGQNSVQAMSLNGVVREEVAPANPTVTWQGLVWSTNSKQLQTTARFIDGTDPDESYIETIDVISKTRLSFQSPNTLYNHLSPTSFTR